MNGLQEQADNAKARDLFWKPLSASGRFPLSSGTITARLLSAAAKNTRWTFTATTQARAQLTQVQPRRTTGWYLPLAPSTARLDTRSAPSTESRQAPKWSPWETSNWQDKVCKRRCPPGTCRNSQRTPSTALRFAQCTQRCTSKGNRTHVHAVPGAGFSHESGAAFEQRHALERNGTGPRCRAQEQHVVDCAHARAAFWPCTG